MNNITIELCKEDRLRIDILNKALGILTGQLEGVVAAAKAKGLVVEKVVEEPYYTPENGAQIPGRLTFHETVAEMPQEAPEPVEPAETQPEPETAQDEPQAAEETAPTPQYTVEDVRAKAMDLMRAGKRAEAKAIVNEYAANITDLPADKCGEVMARLTALEG